MNLLMTLSLVCFSFSSQALTHLESIPLNGDVHFLALGKPAMIKIKGKAPAPISKIVIDNNKMMVESTFALVNLTTGIEMRDEHMKNKYLQVKEFPQAVLKIESINLPEGFEEKATNIKEQNFSGKLSMHGVEREVSGTFSLSESLELSARFILKLTDFGIEIPNYLGVVVADTVTVETTFSLIKKTIEKSK